MPVVPMPDGPRARRPRHRAPAVHRPARGAAPEPGAVGPVPDRSGRPRVRADRPSGGSARIPAVGYIASPPTADAPFRIEEDRRRIVRHAAEHGLYLVAVYVEPPPRSDGFHQLMAAVRAGRAVAVVVPSPDHLRHLGCLNGLDRRGVSRYLRARVLAASDVALTGPGGLTAAG